MSSYLPLVLQGGKCVRYMQLEGNWSKSETTIDKILTVEIPWVASKLKTERKNIITKEQQLPREQIRKTIHSILHFKGPSTH